MKTLSILLLVFLSVGCADMSALKNMEVVIQETTPKAVQKEEPMKLRLTLILPKGRDPSRNALVWVLKNFKIGKFE